MYQIHLTQKDLNHNLELLSLVGVGDVFTGEPQLLQKAISDCNGAPQLVQNFIMNILSTFY